MTDSRLSQLLKWSNPENEKWGDWKNSFELAIYYCCITLDECKQLVEIVDSQRRVHIEEGCRRYFGEAWK